MRWMRAAQVKAAVLRSFNQPLSIEERPRPEPKGEEVLVRVSGSGVCHSDLHISEGLVPGTTLPLVLGQEIAGTAEGIGPVLVYASWGCGQCEMCSRGDEQLCPSAREAGWARDGGYAEYVLVPSRRYLLPLGGLDPVRAAPLADAGVTSYRAVKRASSWLEGELDGGHPKTAIVLGLGGLGQFGVQFLRLLIPETRIIVVDVQESKLRKARTLGVEEATFPDVIGPSTAEAVLDFVGTDETLGLASRAVKRGGVVVQIGEAGGKTPFGMRSVPFEASFTTSIWGSMQDLATVLEYAKLGRIRWDVESLPLDKANEALVRLRKGEVPGRIVLIP